MAGRADSFPTVTVILRGYSYESCRCVAQGMVGSKLRSIEVAMNTPGAPEIINKLSNEFGNEILVGAGTVTTPQRARSAIEAGSKFLLSPICFSDELFAIAKEAHVLSVPAAFSPSEICEMLEKGADIVKVFPASRLRSAVFFGYPSPAWPHAAHGSRRHHHRQRPRIPKRRRILCRYRLRHLPPPGHFGRKHRSNTSANRTV